MRTCCSYWLVTHASIVAGVVRTGSKLVDEDRAVFKDEELDAEDADVVERLGDLGGIAAGAGGRILVDAGGKDGDREDAVAVEVLGNGERGRFAVRVARDDDGDLKLEGEALFEHAVHAAEVAEGLADVLDRGDSGLAFAVIAEAGGLENAGQERGVEGVDVGFAAHGGMRGDGHAGHFGDEVLLDVAVLGDGDGGGRRADAQARLLEVFERGGGDVLELGRDGLHPACERGEAGHVVVLRFDLLAGDFARGAGLAGFEHGDVVAHRRGGLGEHAAELAAAHQAERFARHQHFIGVHMTEFPR